MTTASIAQPMISYALPDNPAARLATQVGLAILGTLVLVLAAKTKVELGFVDLSLQTLAVFLVGAVYGMRLGVATLLLYMAEGASGVLPVFQGETAGLAYMVGPTGGYLLGFVLAAGIVGWAADRGWDRGVVRFLPTCDHRPGLHMAGNDHRPGEGVARWRRPVRRPRPDQGGAGVGASARRVVAQAALGEGERRAGRRRAETRRT
jgi:hypothetical protein